MHPTQAAGASAKFQSSLSAGAPSDLGGSHAGHRFTVQCLDKDGNLKWEESFDNLVVQSGLDDILSKYYSGSGYTAAHYVGLKLAGTVANGDTMASHAGWAEESAAYSQATRPVFTPGVPGASSPSGREVNNSASKAVFSFVSSATIAGVFLTTSNVKGGTAGILIGAGDFPAPRAVANQDVLNVTVAGKQTAS